MDNFEKNIAYANGEMELISLFSKAPILASHLFFKQVLAHTAKER